MRRVVQLSAAIVSKGECVAVQGWKRLPNQHAGWFKAGLCLPQTNQASRAGVKTQAVLFAVAVQVIDFEYSGYNPRAFDIANHFCEVIHGCLHTT